MKSIFILHSHAPKDKGPAHRLMQHIRAMLQDNSMWAVTCECDILAGAILPDERIHQIEAASIIFLLLSPDFMNENVFGSTIKNLVEERRVSGVLSVIPILLSSQEMPAYFRDFKALPSNQVPILQWRPRERAFDDIVKALKMVIDMKMEQKA